MLPNWWAYVFPIVVIVESMAASLIFAIDGKFGSSIYWFFAAAITFAATFLIPKLG